MSETIDLPESSEANTPSTGTIGKILVVDDERSLRTILVSSLKTQNYDAHAAGSGAEALERLRAEDFDILLSDLMMPEMDGLALLQSALEIDPNLISLMMTGQGTIQTAVDAMKRGAFDYVLKPFRLETMMPVLTRAMNSRHLMLENVQLREAVAIHELSQTIAFTLEPSMLLSKLADAALQQSEADEVSVLLPTAEGRELYVAVVRGEKRERLLGERIPFDQSIAGWVGHKLSPVILNGEVHDPRFKALWPRPEIRSSVSIPMQVANKLVGILNLNFVERPRRFTLGQMKALTILAGTAAAALESASLYEQLQEAEKSYRSIFENAVDGIFQASHEGIYLKANPSMARILGYDSPEDLISSITNISSQIFVAPDKCAYAMNILEVEGNLQAFEVEAYRKDGERIWLSMNLSAVESESDGKKFCEGMVEDITERKRTERELRKLSSIVESSTDFIGVAAADGPVLFINSAGQEMIGLDSAKEALTTQFIDYVAESDRERIHNEVLPALFRDGHWEGETVFQHLKTGTLIPMLQHVFMIAEDETHQRLGMATICRDITERNRAERALRESQERYRDLVENARDIIYSHDLQGNYLSSNRAGEEITGYTLTEALAMNMADTVAPDSLEKAREMLERKLAGEKITAYELALLTKDGRRIPVEVNTRLILKDGVPVGVTGVAREITERKQAEAELKRLAAAVDQTADSIVITNTDGEIEYVNPAFERISGYSRKEVIGQNPRLLKSEENDPAIYRDLWETIIKGDVWTGQLVNRKKDGSKFIERVTISAVYDESGVIVNFIAVKQDTTSQVQLEEQLRQSQKLEAIGQLAGGVAHDFNNLLTVINGYSDLLLRGFPPGDSNRLKVEEIRKAGDRAAGLTRQLLAFSRKQVLQPKLLQLNAIVADIEKMLHRLIGEDIDLLTVLDPALGQIKADPGQIEQVILNLAVNARDAMPQGGKLTIETSNVYLTNEYTRNYSEVKAGNYVTVAVSDNGCGMDANTRKHIFEPFFTTKAQGKGTGLGLSTVHGIVNQSEGSLSVYSEVGKGTTFKVYLPRVDEVAQTETANESGSVVTEGTETVLLTEDEAPVRELTKTILQMNGYQVLEAANGVEAVEIYKKVKGRIDLVLTDVVMPRMGGRELVQTLAQLDSGIKALYLSGYTDDAIVHHGLLDQNMAFLQKPFTPDALLRKVRQVLDGPLNN